MNTYLKSIAIPKEHGGWGFIAEGVLVGLCLAFSLDGIILSALFTLLFLLSQPFKIYIQDCLSKKSLPRTLLARNVSAFYLIVFLVLFFMVFRLNKNLFWVPLFICLVLSSFQFISSVKTKDRNIFAEILSASAIALVVSSILIAAGAEILFAFVVWFLIAIRIVTSIVYVRNRLDKSKGMKFSKQLVVLAQILGLIIISIIVYANEFSFVIVLAFGMLVVRAIYGISDKTRNVRPQKIGVMEIVFGLINSVCIILGV